MPSPDHAERMFFHGINEQLTLIRESQQRTEVFLQLIASTLTVPTKSNSVSRVAPASASATN